MSTTTNRLPVFDTAEAIATRKGVPADVFNAVATSWETFYYVSGETAEATTARLLVLIDNSCEAGLGRVSALFALDAIVSVEGAEAYEAYRMGRSYEDKARTLSLIESTSLINKAFSE